MENGNSNPGPPMRGGFRGRGGEKFCNCSPQMS